MNERISLKVITEQIEIPGWVKAITLTAFSQDKFSEKKLNNIYNLFAKLLGMTADEARKKYALRYTAKFEHDRTDYLVEFFDSPANERRNRY